MAASVALVGYYGYGNFGDDLMAAIFARYLQQIGVPYSVYRLTPAALGGLTFQASPSLNCLLDSRNTLIWGGGGLLISWSPVMYKLLFPGVASAFSALLDDARRRRLMFLAFSIGGSGHHRGSVKPGFKEKFLQAATYVTVRNPQDVAFVRARGIAGEYFPDVVWQTPLFFPAAAAPRGKPAIGIDLYWRNLARSGSLRAAFVLRNVIRRMPSYDFLLLDTSVSGRCGHPGLIRLLRAPNVRAVRCTTVGEVLRELASLDLLLSSRLHSGVVCMSYGIPFVSLGGEPKTHLMMTNLGMSNMCFAGPGFSTLAHLLLDEGRLQQLLNRPTAPAAERMTEESRGHLDRMSEMLS